jgi:Sec1 family
VIVFVLGGISQMEINALNNLAALTHKEIVIGSTSLLTPRDFVLEVGETEPLEVEEEDETPKAKKGDPKASGAQAAADRLDAQRRARASATQKQTAVDDVALDSDDDGPAAKKPSTRGGSSFR